MEERKNQISSGGFGADDSYKHLKAVQEKTGAKIEMSSGKDQSLTFLITGKTDVVQRAKRELLREFQVICLTVFLRYSYASSIACGSFTLGTSSSQ